MVGDVTDVPLLHVLWEEKEIEVVKYESKKWTEKNFSMFANGNCDEITMKASCPISGPMEFDFDQEF